MQPSFLLMLLSIAVTAICWGIYGPILHWGQADMGNGRLRTFICVGIAYLLVAVVVPLIFMYATGWEMEEKYHAKTWGVTWSLLGGALGAVGALGIILAFTYSPFKSLSPLVVMPLVFGLAPVVNTFFTMWMNRGKGLEAINPFFAAGLILTAVGAATVLVFAPKLKKDDHAAKPAVVQEKAERAAEVEHMGRPSPLTPNEATATERLSEEIARADADAEQSNDKS